MYIYAQQGNGKKDRIERGITDDTIRGVVLSPYFEKPENLARFVAKLREECGERVDILLDPQFYASAFSDAKHGRLPEYPYFHKSLARTAFSPSNMVTYVSEVLEYQQSLGLSRLLTPTVYFRSFDDAWATIAFQLAQASADSARQNNWSTPVLASFAFDVGALSSPQGVLDFLNEATQLELSGFYIVVGRSERSSRDQFDESALLNLMKLVNGLSEHNEYEVVCGYTDFVGLLLHAIGARATASGWSNSSRRFAVSSWSKSSQQKGGGAPPARYTSGPLLATLSVAGDLTTVARAGRLSDVQSSSKYDSALTSGNQASWIWNADTACLHHWQTLADQAIEISSQGSTANNLRAAENIIKEAINRHNALKRDSAVALDVNEWRPDLEVWLRAITAFRKDAGI